ncbi:MAG: tRNA pseudouridine(13) synthase TruD [Thermoprotei archaeon]|nr:tRNA pseudouridine(13) synthase TruD [Thermoprotei archaeon]
MYEDRFLELLYGIEERLHNFSRVSVRLKLPWGFRVFEVGSPRWFRGSGWSLYFVRKVGVSTLNACRELSRRLNSGRFTFAGLKDACSVSFQYVSFRSPRVKADSVDLGTVKAWLLGEGSPIALGSHLGNIFRITLEAEDPEGLLKTLSSISMIPAFYGPQRFGVHRPSTHLYGLSIARREPGALAREFRYRYPLEPQHNLGLESRRLEEALEGRDPWKLFKGTPRIYIEALQAYLFNRALSKAVRKKLLNEVRETIATIKYCNETVTVPVVRLPSPQLATSKTKWAALVEEVAGEEGLKTRDLKGLTPSLRPLYFPLKIRSVNATRSNVVFTACLPPSAYATILLRETVELKVEGECLNIPTLGEEGPISY